MTQVSEEMQLPWMTPSLPRGDSSGRNVAGAEMRPADLGRPCFNPTAAHIHIHDEAALNPTRGDSSALPPFPFPFPDQEHFPRPAQ